MPPGSSARPPAPLTLDFADREQFEHHHVCFHVGDAVFDSILGRLQAAGITYRSTPHGEDDMKINTRLGGKNVYWKDADGHTRRRGARHPRLPGLGIRMSKLRMSGADQSIVTVNRSGQSDQREMRMSGPRRSSAPI